MVLGLNAELNDLHPEVWITSYPIPFEEQELVLERVAGKSSKPFSLPAQLAVQNRNGSIYIFNNLPVEHTHANKIGAVFKGIPESVCGFDCSCSQHLESNYRYLNIPDHIDGLIGEEIKHVIMNPVVISPTGDHPR